MKHLYSYPESRVEQEIQVDLFLSPENHQFSSKKDNQTGRIPINASVDSNTSSHMLLHQCFAFGLLL